MPSTTIPPGLPDVETPPPEVDPRSTRQILLAVERKLDAFLEAIEDEEEAEERPPKNLDGVIQGGPRDQSQSLG